MTTTMSVAYSVFAQHPGYWNHYGYPSDTIISSSTPVVYDHDGSATTLVPKKHLELLEYLYYTDNFKTLFTFLDHHPFLVPILIEAFFQIARFFPSFVGFLEVHIDPDDSTDRQIMLSIMTSLSPEDALATLDQLDEQWWFDEVGKAQGKLCIMLGFQ
jgi:hypothetical protein